jgi:hypothetical protein
VSDRKGRRLRRLTAGFLAISVLIGLVHVARTNADSDGDAIPDCRERAGLRSVDGTTIGHTDPEVADTDDDGVTDGGEVVLGTPSSWIEDLTGYTWSCSGKTVSSLSDPATPDTDGDLLDDAYELSAGSSAFTGDSDGDGLSDGRERSWGSDPNSVDTDGDGLRDGDDVVDGLSPVVVDERIDADTWEREFRDGVLLGDVVEVDSVPQLLGSIVGGASSSVPVVGWLTGGIADGRDVAANAIRGDWTSAGVSGAGIVPYVGDTAKTSKQLLKFAAKYPHKVSSAIKALAGLESIPVSVRVSLLRVTNQADLDKLRQTGLSDEVVVKLAKRGAVLAGLAQSLDKAAAHLVIPDEYADDEGFVGTFADAEGALRAYAEDADGERDVSDGPVYFDEFPESAFSGGRLIDACTACSPRPDPGASTLRVAKLGAQLYSDTLQSQIDKDAFLNGQGYTVEWHFIAGRTGLFIDPRLLVALDEAGIPYYIHLPI